MNKDGGEMGITCESVTMARFLTTGRWWERRGARTRSGEGLKIVVDMWFGNLLIRIDKIANVSTRASGGVDGYENKSLQCLVKQQMMEFKVRMQMGPSHRKTETMHTF